MLIDAGADVIVQARTGLSSIGMTEVLRRKLGVPVIDAVTAAGSMLVSALAARELQEDLIPGKRPWRAALRLQRPPSTLSSP